MRPVNKIMEAKHVIAMVMGSALCAIMLSTCAGEKVVTDLAYRMPVTPSDLGIEPDPFEQAEEWFDREMDPNTQPIQNKDTLR